MTVKCLNELDKSVIAAEFLNDHYTIETLATHFDVSRRTIVRVLEERGVDPGIRRRPGRKSKKQPAPAGPVVIPTRTPWYRRIIEKVVPLFN